VSLAGKKVWARTYKAPVAKLPVPLPVDEVPSLVQCLRNGDSIAKTRLVEGHMGLASQIVGRYIARFDLNNQELIDDLWAEAMYAVTLAVELAKTNLKDDNITPYIVTTVHDKVSDCLARDRLIPVPPRTYRRHGGKVQPPRVVSGESSLKSLSHSLSKIIADDLLEQALRTNVEREIVRMRLKGMTDSRIGKVLGMGVMQIGRVRAAIERRYNAIVKGIQ